MSSLEQKVEEKLNYLHEMQKKYRELNKKTKDTYDWRERAINDQIAALEELKQDKLNNNWDDCYYEDLREARG